MQFHVLVHGTGREGTADKVQQLLSSIKITPELLHQPGPDKPLVIKRRFNETQASALRDKLIGLGLQSSIQSLREPGLSRTSATPEKPAPLSAALKQLSQTMQGLLRKPSAAQVATATRLGRLSAWMLCIRVLFRPFLGTVACRSSVLCSSLSWPGCLELPSPTPFCWDCSSSLFFWQALSIQRP